jgi:deoxyadenosine/deoxycytidine kinase
MVVAGVFVEGNIASGKTSVLRELKRRGHLVIEEDIGSFSGELEAYHAERTQQCCMQLQRKIMDTCDVAASELSALARGKADLLVFAERSSFSSAAVFGVVYREAGMLLARDVEYLTCRHEATRDDLEASNRFLFVTAYLRTPAVTCMQRATSRARPSERSMDYSLFETLHDRHEYCFNASAPRLAQLSDLHPQPPGYGTVVVVDGEASTAAAADDLLSHVQLLCAEARARETSRQSIDSPA